MDTRLVARKKQLESWAALIHECKNSGMKTKDWLAQNSISKDQYYYWLKIVRERAYIEDRDKSEQLNQVVRIECDDTSSNTSSDMITINNGWLNISILMTTDVAVVKTVMEVAVHAK